MHKGLIIVLLSFFLFAGSPLQAEPIVAAASSLRHVWPTLMQNYPDSKQPKVTFGSSGNLLRQIEQGAPYNVFLSANTAYAKTLVENFWQQGRIMPFAYGQIAWLAPKRSELGQWIENQNNKQITQKIPFPNIQKLALANPRFAPYGIAAKQALNSLDNIDASNIQLAMAENASQAVQFSLSGAVAGGIVAYPLLAIDTIKNNNSVVYRLIDATLHEPIKHVLVIPAQSSVETENLYHFLLSETAQQILQRFGFSTTTVPE